ncbi:MAG: amidohydrolase family protein, partial [Acidobacteria bacterium]|nr:amidohydrolase family protein [Acidobacteriota bacterium]
MRVTLATVVISLMVWFGGTGAEPPPVSVQAFVGARLIDGTGAAPVENAVILVRDGQIEAVGPKVEVPAGAERIDLKGKTVIPGLINSHGHVGQARGLDSRPEVNTDDNVLRQLGLYARYGVTTVFSLGGDREAGFRAREAQKIGSLDRARLYLAGTVVTATTPEQAESQVQQVALLKPDFIKFRVDDNLGTTAKMPPAVFQAVIDAAHRQKLRAAAHIFYLEDAKALARAGVDFLAHSVRDREVDPELISLLKERYLCLCPTLTREVSAFAYDSTPEFFSDPYLRNEADPAVLAALESPERQKAVKNSAAYRRALEVASLNLKKLSDAGVPIAFGTDSGPAGRFQGYFEHMELELMAKAGLAPMKILVAATSGAARCLGVADSLGSIAPGKWADLVVLEKD